jgi:outer membrane protein assembly factor BamA
MAGAMHPARLLAGLAAGLIPLAAASQETLPSLAQLEAQGAVIGEITVDTHNIFDLDDPHERNFVFRAANALHVKTRPWLIRRLLLFKSGEPLSRHKIDETERLIRSNSTVYDVFITPVGYRNGVVDLEVKTRDTWTLQPGAKLRREGGATSGGFNLKETNLAGTGTTVGLERSADVDRTGTQFELSHDHLFDGWTRIALTRATYDDGSAASLSLNRPFYALDTRWAGGGNVAKFDRTDSLYQGGEMVGEYRHIQHAGEVYGGWSPGLIGRWTHRFSAGVNYQGDTYAADPAKPTPIAVPSDRTLAGPFLRHEAIEDDFQQVVNRDRIQRPEYLQMGFHSMLHLGRSVAAFGATEQPWSLNATASKGFRRSGGHEVLTEAQYSSLFGSATGDVRKLGLSARGFVPQKGSFLLHLGAAVDTVRSSNAADELLLGGDNGLRGYPLRYQRGAHRIVFTAEERYYTNWYPLRLFRVGFASYFDVGRAWGGQLGNPTPGWLSDFGFGLRVLSTRASFGNILHVDFAFPLNRGDPGLRKAQFLVTTSKTF